MTYMLSEARRIEVQTPKKKANGNGKRTQVAQNDKPTKESRDSDINKVMADLVRRTDEFNKKNIKTHPEWKDQMMDVSKDARDRAKKAGYAGKNIEGKR